MLVKAEVHDMNAHEMLAKKAPLARWLQNQDIPALAPDAAVFLIRTAAQVRRRAPLAGDLRHEALEYADALLLHAMVAMGQSQVLLSDLADEAKEIEEALSEA